YWVGVVCFNEPSEAVIYCGGDSATRLGGAGSDLKASIPGVGLRYRILASGSAVSGVAHRQLSKIVVVVDGLAGDRGSCRQLHPCDVVEFIVMISAQQGDAIVGGSGGWWGDHSSRVFVVPVEGKGAREKGMGRGKTPRLVIFISYDPGVVGRDAGTGGKRF